MFYFLINITNNIVTTAKVKSNALVISCKNKLTIKDIIPKQSNTKLITLNIFDQFTCFPPNKKTAVKPS
jgi:hypothetical protein